MLTFTSQQLYILVASVVWPLTRVLGVISIAPPFGNSYVPMTVKILLGAAISLIIAPSVPVPAAFDPVSLGGLMILAQQFVIGLAMGFAIRIVFAAIEAAGEFISMSMGLGFAVFFDPQTDGRSSAISQFYSLLATLIFLSLNGHLILLSVLADSFNTLPISATPVSALGFRELVLWGSNIFSMGLQISLPIVATLLIANISLGVLTRAAPQLNLFGIGFSITLMVGFLLMAVTLPYLLNPIQHALAESIELVKKITLSPTITPQKISIPMLNMLNQ